MKENYHIFLLQGIFNLPHIDWDTKSSLPGASSDEQRMMKEFFGLMNDYNLIQHVRGATHNAGNTLDLLLTNNLHLIHSYESIPSPHNVSHHSLLNIKIHFDLHLNKQEDNMHKTQSVFDEYNLFSKAVNWTAIKAAMKEKSWAELHTYSTKDQLQTITDWVVSIIKEYVPKRKTSNKKQYKIPRDRKILFRKRKNILKKITISTIPKKLIKKLSEIEIKLKLSYEF